MARFECTLSDGSVAGALVGDGSGEAGARAHVNTIEQANKEKADKAGVPYTPRSVVSVVCTKPDPTE